MNRKFIFTLSCRKNSILLDDKRVNVIQFLEKLKLHYNLQSPEDWNSITRNQIKSQLNGIAILNKYPLYELKCLGCPEGKSIFTTKQSKGYWNEKQNVIQFLDKIKEKYNLKTPEDWNSVTRKQIQFYGGGTLLNTYSIYEIKCLGCPEGKFIFDKPIETKPSGFWNEKENVIQFLNLLKEKYNLKTFEDWNSITAKQIRLQGGSSLFFKYKLYDLKCLGFPDGKFNKTNQKPSGYWENEQNVIQFLLKLKKKYNLQTVEDWNSITYYQIKLNGGRSLFTKYSLYDLKCLGFPDGKLFFDKPKQLKGYWDEEQNVIQFLEKLKEKYNLKTPEDWNLITYDQIKLNGGRSLLSTYSMYDLKCLGCPDGKLSF